MLKTINKNQVNITLDENTEEIVTLIKKYEENTVNQKKETVKKSFKYLLIIVGVIFGLALFTIALPVYLIILIILIIGSISILNSII